ncbi:MAG: DUF4112 domain-containing protein [Pseudomonadota bacterium]|nr:DUF4112 domain-containing protein [Pseudomonadota bacterium]
MAPTPSELQSIRKTVDDWRRISDRLFEVGPLKVGLDGVLTWIPGIGDAYGLGASAFLLAQAARAGASQECITRMAVLLGVDAVVGSVPVAGDLFDVVFRAHARAADVLKDEIDRLHAAATPALEAAPRHMKPKPDIDLRTPPSAPPPPAPVAPPPPPEPPVSEESEWEQARRVEELRAQYRDKGGLIDGRRR